MFAEGQIKYESELNMKKTPAIFSTEPMKQC